MWSDCVVVWWTTKKVERAKGVEPSTFSLATRRSTTELCPLNNFLLSKTLCLNTNNTLTFRFDLIMERGINQDSSVTTVTRMSQERWVRLTRWLLKSLMIFLKTWSGVVKRSLSNGCTPALNICSNYSNFEIFFHFLSYDGRIKPSYIFNIGDL